jgi:GAF domain-containing protein
MNPTPSHSVDLESVIITAELDHRPLRTADFLNENVVITSLVREMAKSPEDIFQKLVEAVLKLCDAQSAGISLLDKEHKAFYWPAIAGQWKHYIGGGTPRDFGPCGTVLDRNATLLFSHPERHFNYLAAASPAIEEGLLAPFYINGKAVGTIWAITHDVEHQFDAEDVRALESLSKFTSAAYKTLTDIGAFDNQLR